MKITLLRRVGAASLAPALAAGLLLAPPSAQAAPDPVNSFAFSAARWLDDQLTDGFVHNPNFGGFDDYGLSLDVFFALDGLGTRTAAAESIIDAFAADPTVYTSSDAFGYSGSRSAGATGKLAAAVIDADRDPTAFGGHDLISEVESTVVPSGDEAGRAEDVLGEIVPPNTFPNADYSNTIGQSFVVRALSYTGAGNPVSDELQPATDYLLEQQCPDGSFRVNMFDASTDRTCGDPATSGDDSISVDATAFAIQALLAAQRSGATGVGDDLADAVAYLVSVQAADGSYADAGTPNSNSTGLAASALQAAGETGPAASAASWIVGLQVTDAVGEGTALATELGAIAFDRTALDDGRADGITDVTRDQWIRATAQAALGVNAQLPAGSVAVTAPTGFVQGGTAVTIGLAGLTKGERFSAGFSGGARATGTADAQGRGSVVLTAPPATGSALVTVTGSRTTRVGSTTVSVLGPRTVTPRLRSSTVQRGKSQRVTITGLAAGEPLKIYQSNSLKKSATASSTGTYSFSYKVGRSRDKKTVKVVGAFPNRTGSKAFRVK